MPDGRLGWWRRGRARAGETRTTDVSPPPPSGGMPSVTVVLPVMDRAASLARSLPSLLGQSYAELTVTVTDLGSEDEIESVLAAHASPRLRQVRTPRPEHFSFATAANIGIRYSASDLVLIWGVDSSFDDAGVLERAVDALRRGEGGEERWLREWHVANGYGEISAPMGSSPDLGARYPLVYLLDGGGLLLVERGPLQAIGGFNEWLDDWGYKDTDVNMRLELAGLGRLPFPGISTEEHSDDVRAARLRYPNRLATWHRNREVADLVTRALGPCTPSAARPGRVARVCIDGVEYDGTDAPQQRWQFDEPIPPSLEAEIRAIRAAHEEACLAR